MINSLAILLILGMLLHYLFERIRLPGFLGILLLGVLAGPYMLDILDPELQKISADLRRLALIVILLRAGLGISREKLNTVGSNAIKMSFIPGLCEGFTIALLATLLIPGFTFVQGGILGFIIAAVSPAVVVPLMIELQERGFGKKRNIPTLILAGSSLDDVFAIVIFGSFLNLYTGDGGSILTQLLDIPISIILGIGIGILFSLIMIKVFKKYHIRDTKKVLGILAIAVIITMVEELLETKIPIAGYLGVMTIGFFILEKLPVVAKRLSKRFSKLWVLAEIILFSLVGAEVNPKLAIQAGLVGITIISIGLLARSIGVFIALLGSKLNSRERIFCAISYTPKATVQAAIGSIPLAMGVDGGELMLAISVLSIVLTAPLGAIFIRKLSPKLLDSDTASA